MERIMPETEMEIEFSNKAIQYCRYHIKDVTEQSKILENKKFHMGDVVVKKGTNVIDVMFDVGEGKIGKIVGWDAKNNYYRVFYSKANPFIGVEEDKLDNFYGTVPFEILAHDPFSLDMMLLRS